MQKMKILKQPCAYTLETKIQKNHKNIDETDADKLKSLIEINLLRDLPQTQA